MMLTAEQILSEIDGIIEDVLRAPLCYGLEGAAEAIIYQMIALKHQITYPTCHENCPHHAYSNMVYNTFHNALILTANLQQQEPDYQKRQQLLSFHLRRLVTYFNSRHPIRSIMILENGNVWVDGKQISESNQSYQGYELRELIEVSGPEAEELKKELSL